MKKLILITTLITISLFLVIKNNQEPLEYERKNNTVTSKNKDVDNDASVDLNKKWAEEQKPFLQVRQNNISSTAYSPNGKYILSIGDGMVKLLDAKSTLEIRTFIGQSAAFTHNGKFIVVAYYDKLLIFDIKTTKPIKTLQDNDGIIHSVNFSDDDKYIVSSSYNEIKIWNLESGRQLKTIKKSKGYSERLYFIKNNKYIVLVKRGETHIFDIESGLLIYEFRAEDKHVIVNPDNIFYSNEDYKYNENNIIKLSINNKKITKEIELKGHQPARISINYRDSGEIIKTFKNNLNKSFLLNFTSEKGKYLFSNHYGQVKYIDNINKEQKIYQGDGNNYPKFSRDGKYLTINKENDSEYRANNIVKLINIKGKQKEKIFKGDSGSFSFDSKLFVLHRDKSILIYDLDKNKKIKVLNYSVNAYFDKSYFNENKTCLISIDGNDDTRILWNVKSGRLINKTTGIILGKGASKKKVAHMNFIEDSDLVSIDYFKYTEIINCKSGKTIRRLKNKIIASKLDKNLILSYSNSGDGGYYEEKKELSVDLISNEKKVKSFEIDYNPLSNGETPIHIKFSHNGKYILYYSNNKVQLFDVKTRKTIRSFSSSLKSIYDVSFLIFNPKDNLILLGSENGIVSIWDIKSGKKINIVNSFNSENPNGGSFVSFTSNAKYIIVEGDNENIKLLDSETGKTIKTFNGNHLTSIYSVTIDQKNELILSASDDGLIKLWNIETGKELLTIALFKDGEWVSITPSGYFSSSKNGAKHINILTSPLTVINIDKHHHKFYRPDLISLASTGTSIPSIISEEEKKEARTSIITKKNQPLPQDFSNKKVALLIGNKNYNKKNLWLKNPINDIRAIESVLRELKFEVLSLEDSSKRQMEDGLDIFYEKAKNADIAFVYYSGHGLQIFDRDIQRVRNYLLPIDSNVNSLRDLKQLVILDRIIEDSSYAKVAIILIDACRDNPLYDELHMIFKKDKVKSTSLSKGLGRININKNDILIGFSTLANQVARDGDNNISPYANALRNNLKKDQDIRLVLGSVREEVMKATNNTQEPETINKLSGKMICLTGKCN